MAITKFIPEVWSAQILTTLEKAHVYGAVSNRNYEGDISEYGDTVHIIDVADPTITPYVRNTNLSDPEALTDDEQILTIDQANSFNFQIDDLDKAQVRNSGGLVDEAAKRAAWGLRDLSDRFLAAKMAGAGFGLGLVDGTTAANVYDDFIVPASVRLDEQNVPEEQRWAVVSPSIYGKLQLDDRFIKAAYSGTGALHNGMVGDAGGFRIYKSNNAPQANRTGLTITTTSGNKTITAAAGTFSQGDVGLTITGTGVGASNAVESVSADGATATVTVNSTASATVADGAISGGGQLAIAGSSIATTYAEQILKTVAYSPEKRFGDALKGLHVYGGRVVRPEALAVASIKTA